jgi:hypothetical protein
MRSNHLKSCDLFIDLFFATKKKRPKEAVFESTQAYANMANSDEIQFCHQKVRLKGSGFNYSFSSILCVLVAE